MKKRILSLVIGLLVALSMITSSYADTYRRLDSTEEYEALFDSLGVFPSESISGRVTVARGDFVSKVTALMKLDTIENATTPFDDVEDGTELASCLKYALMLGMVSEGSAFLPTEPITGYQALKICISALGYGSEAAHSGGYPVGYITVARRVGIDIALSDSHITGSEAIMLLGLMCDAYTKDITSISIEEDGCDYTLTEGDTFLYKYHKIYTVSGIVQASDVSYLYDSSESVRTRCINIGSRVFALGEGVDCPLGYYATVYVKEGDFSVDTVLYASLAENNVTVLTWSNEVEINGNVITYTDEYGKDKKIKCDSYFAVLYNGKAFENFTESDIKVKNGKVIAIDNNSDGTADVISIYEGTYLVVDYVDSVNGIIYDENFVNNIYLDGKDVIYTSSVPLKSIKSGDVAEVFVSKDGNYAEINIIRNKVKGILSGISSDGKLVIDSTEYEISDYFNEFYMKGISIGEEIAVCTDGGICIAVASWGNSEMKYGYLDNARSKQGIDNEYMVKIFSESGEVEALTLSTKVRLDGGTVSAETAYAVLADKLGTVIKYRTDDRGKLRTVNTAMDNPGLYVPAEDGRETVKRYNFDGYDTTVKIPYKITGYFVPHFTIDTSTVIFCIAESESADENRFSLGNGLGFISNDTQVPGNMVHAYNVSEAGKAEVIVYLTDTYSTAIDGLSTSGLVSKFTEAIDSEGVEGYRMELYYADSFVTYFIKNEAPFVANGINSFAVGDFVRYTVNSAGYITNITKDFDNKTKILLGSTADNTNNHYYYGDVYILGDSSTAVKTADGKLIYVPMAVGDCGYVRDGDVSTMPKNLIKTYKHTGDKCSKALIKCYYSTPQEIYIYE